MVSHNRNLWYSTPVEKERFSRRLRDALKKAEAPAGAAALAREFNLRYAGRPVTGQAVGKWLAGKALPSQDKIRALSVWLEVTPHWLRFGEGGAGTAPAYRELQGRPAVAREEI